MTIILISIAPGVKTLMRKTDTGMLPKFTLHKHQINIIIYICTIHAFLIFFQITQLKKNTVDYTCVTYMYVQNIEERITSHNN